MEWIEKLQAPGLLLAGLVIWWLFQLLRDRDKMIATELAETTKVLTKVAVLLDVICRRTTSRGNDGGK